MTHLIFGVDGMNHDYAQKRIEAGDMPTLKQLQNREKTEYGEFKSYICEDYETPHTAPCWTTIYTGLKPEEHGITSGGWNDGDSEFHVTNTIWDQIDKDMYLYGMPMTYKAKPINGKMVSGFISTTIKSLFENCVYPDSLEEELVDDFIEYTSSYVARVKTEGAKPETDTEEFYTELSFAENKRMRQFEETYEGEEIVAYGTTLVDKIGHVAGISHDSKFAREAYVLLDMMLGDLMNTLKPETVTIISDHGFSEYSHDLHGYYLDTTGRGMDSIFDFTPYMEDIHGVENPEYGPTGEQNNLTESEVQDVKDQLNDLGYF